MLEAMRRHATVMRIVCASAFAFGLLITLGSIGTLADYWTGYVEGWSKWGEKGPAMALNTATLFLMTGAGLMGLSAVGEHLLSHSARRDWSESPSSS